MVEGEPRQPVIANNQVMTQSDTSRRLVLLIALGAGLGFATWSVVSTVNAVQKVQRTHQMGRRGYGMPADYQWTSLDDLERIVEREPENPAALIHLGRKLARLGRSEEARQHFKRGCEILEPFVRGDSDAPGAGDTADNSYLLGIAFAGLGHPEAADFWFERAASMQRVAADRAEGRRERARSYYNLACYESLAGNLPQALAALDKAVDHGFWRDNHLELDEDLDPLRALPEFEAIRVKAAEQPDRTIRGG